MKAYLILLLIAILAGCDNNDSSTIDFCPTSENVEQFPWIVELIDDLGTCGACHASVVRGRYNGATVVFTVMDDPLCNGIFTGPLYDCRGVAVKYFSSSNRDQQQYREHVLRDMILGQCEEFSTGQVENTLDG